MQSILRTLPLATTVADLCSNQLDLVEYVNATCDHIDAVESELQALLPEPDRRSRLLTEAHALRERYPDPATRPPLFGALLGVKDMFRVDGFPTRAGSQLPAELFAGSEASCVTRLREAGALILGKTVTTEFAFFEPGPTRNPFNLEHTPGGSSSGSAAAVAAGYCPVALGTQTIGSTIRPAAYCGVVGLKPSYGRISSDGLILFSESADTIGLLTQDVAGCAQVASLLFQQWQPVFSTRTPVLGIPEGAYLAQMSTEGLATFEHQLALLETRGYVLRRIRVLDDIERINRLHTRLVRAELARVHADWFSRYQALYRPRTVAAIQEGMVVPADELEAGRLGCLALRNELHALMQQHKVDLWACPAARGPAPEGIAETGDPSLALPWTHAGLPSITLPAGFAENGLPLGLQLVGAFMGDEQLLAWAELVAEILRVSSPT